jgi:hypothetical protein
MTQDEREQKALEAARVTIDHDKIRDRKAMALAFRWAERRASIITTFGPRSLLTPTTPP